MKIVFAGFPAYGHLYPMLPLALACADAGHDVTIATGEPFLGTLPLPTVRGSQEGVTLPGLMRETCQRYPDLKPGPELAGHLFGETAVRYVEPVLRGLFERVRPDLVVYDALALGAAMAATACDVRAVAFGLGLWNPPLVCAHTIAGLDLGLPDGYLDIAPPSVQNPVPLPSSRIPLRPVAWAPPWPLPPGLPGSTRTTVYVTLGTVFHGAVDVLRCVVLETAAHDVDVLVALGSDGDPAALGRLPSNVHLAKFVPQAAVLRHVDLVVHHGGAGTMLGTFAAGLPQVVIPQGADQPYNAAAIERVHAGRAVRGQVAGAVGSAVGAMLADSPERLAARGIAAEIAAMPSPESVVTMLTRV